jgi:surface protein
MLLVQLGRLPARSLIFFIIMEDDPSPTVKRQKTTIAAAEEEATILDLLRSLPSNIVGNYIYPFAVKVIQNHKGLIKAVDEYLNEFYIIYDEVDEDENNDENRINYPIGDWDVSRVDNFTSVFDLRRNLKVWHFIEDLSRWNVAKGTSFARMFYGCDAFQSDLSNWDTGRATDLHDMFEGCTSFYSDLLRWNVANATNLSRMFYGCISFNSNVLRWDVANAIGNMDGMFAGCVSFNRDFVATWPLPDEQRRLSMFVLP